jgi:hypothetical protein
MRALVAALAAIGFAARTLQAQELSCAETETLSACRARLDKVLEQAAGAEAVATRGTDTVAAVAAAKTVGIGQLGSSLPSAISDFLPTIAGALGLTQTTTENGATSLESNLRLPIGVGLQRLRLRGTLQKPELYQPLQDSLPAATREARVAALEEELDDFDDVRLSLAWNLESATFGRNFDVARPLLTRVLRAKSDEIDRSARRTADQIYLDVLRTSKDGLDSAQVGRPECNWQLVSVARTVELSCFTAEERLKLTTAMIQSLRATRTAEEQLHRLLTEGGFFRIADLVNNQPQLSVEGQLSLRRDLVGPNDYSVTARYEGGFANFNGLRRYGREKCAAASDTTISAACLQQYLSDPAAVSAMKRGDRFFVTATYSRRADYSMTLASDNVNLNIAGTWDFIAGAGYGRYVTFGRTGEELGRIDLTGEYVFHHDDPTRENRLVAAGTYTYRLSSTLSVAAGVSYASKPEFIGDVDKKFGANFALRYRLLRS